MVENEELPVEYRAEKMLKEVINHKQTTINNILKEVEDLRLELTEIRDKYSQICERLWTIKNTKR